MVRIVFGLWHRHLLAAVLLTAVLLVRAAAGPVVGIAALVLWIGAAAAPATDPACDPGTFQSGSN